MKPPLWIWPVNISAAVQTSLGLSATLWCWANGSVVFPDQLFSAATIVLCSFIGAYMLLGGRADLRAMALGTILMLIASSYAYRSTRLLEDQAVSWLSFPLLLKMHLREDAFISAALWLFAWDFPRGLSSAADRGRIERVILACLATGVGLIVVNLSLVFAQDRTALTHILRIFDAWNPNSHYWTVAYTPGLPAVVYLLSKARRVPPDEKRRVRLFAFGLGLGFGPAMVYVVAASLFPGLTPSLREAGWFTLVMGLFRALILVTPVASAYAVAVEHIFDIRIVVRAAVQYGLAKCVVGLVIVLPFVWLGFFLFERRTETLSSLLFGKSFWGIFTSSVIGAVLVAGRRQAINGIDRLFFREKYDSRRILTTLVDRSRRSGRIDEFQELLTAELRRAFHPESVSFHFLDETQQYLIAGAGSSRALALTSELAYFLAVHGQTVDVDLERPGSSLRLLPETDRRWLADSKFRLVVPLLDRDRRLLGALGLGEKLSELPYTKEDKDLLEAVAAAVIARMESHQRAKSFPSASSGLAMECPSCFEVHDPNVRKCNRCGLQLISSPLPRDIAGKFRLERRVGQGAMGIVYRATDVALGRTVAIKTLPRMAPEDAVFLRREARTMAGIQHPNLALIFGAETWNGYPLIILEFLEQGTLAQKLENGPMPVSDCVRIGLALSSALEKTHGTGLLHGDVKPSNIGFTNDAVPKLMDFGLARMFHLMSSSESVAFPDTTPPNPYAPRNGSRAGAGTPLYMSPEALVRSVPDPIFDLWALALVLYESLTTRNPFERENSELSAKAIMTADLPDIRTLCADCPDSVRRFLETELSRNAQMRSPSAREFSRRLRAAEAALA